MSSNAILSTIQRSPTSEAIHSLLAVYGERRGQEIPGPWFVHALEPLGHPPPTVRQALLRMVQRGSLLVRKQGRTNHYAFTELTRGYITTGIEKIFGPADKPWDQRWTLVQYQFASNQRADRDQVREILEIEGFGQLSRGVFLHPRDRVERIREGLKATGHSEGVSIFRAQWAQDEPEHDLAARVWDLESLAKSYTTFLKRFEALPKRRGTDADRFALRLGLAISYLRIAWDDPDLPLELLPEDWPGHRARHLTMSLYERWLDSTLAHGDRLLTRVSPDHPALENS